VDGKPVATHWGMNKQVSGEARDTLSPFIEQWRARLRERAQQAAEAERNALTSEPVENIVWTRKPNRAGQYSVYVHFYKQHDASMPCSKFELRLKRGSSVRHFKGQVTPGERLKVTDFKI
jgi:hypothetical protein